MPVFNLSSYPLLDFGEAAGILPKLLGWTGVPYFKKLGSDDDNPE
jgi:hypothetical protein